MQSRGIALGMVGELGKRGGAMATDEVIYEPAFGGPAEVLLQLSCDSALIVGEPIEELVQQVRDAVVDLRFTEERSATRLLRDVPSGVYAAKERGRWRALIVPGTPSSDSRARSDRLGRLDNDWDPLVVAADLLSAHWDAAIPVGDDEVWLTGTHVLIEGTSDFGQVVSHRRLRDALQYTVAVGGVHKVVTSKQLRLLPGDIHDPHLWISLPAAEVSEIALTLAWTKLHHPLTDVLYSFQSSRTLFRPYQFKPVLKMIQGESQRILIADEVGLGKTIEAGLIWSELEGRNPLDRVLILCPAALSIKWQTEMVRRFDRKVDLLGKNDWSRFFEQVENGEQALMLGVDSLERLRMTDVAERLVNCGVRFDLVIIDEAHRLRNPNNRTHALGEALADASDALVLLTATPVNLGNRDLFTLLELLDEGRFTDFSTFEFENEPNAVVNATASCLLDPSRSPKQARSLLMALERHTIGKGILKRPDCVELLALLDTDVELTARDTDRAKRLLAGLGTFSGYITRTRKVDVPDAKAIRSPHQLKVQWTEEERAFYQAVREWVARNARADGVPPGFAEQMPLRQTASCIPAMAKRLQLQHSRSDKVESDYFTELGEVPDDCDIRVSHLRVPVPAVDSKFQILLEGLRQIHEAGLDQVMVFSYFRLTLEYLHECLQSQGFTTRVMHGGVPLTDRETIMADFRNGVFRILLISEVGSEGLDFEFCGALINYDLPWNPMRVEQRIGRLDRFGQRHEKIHIYNFSVDGTIEDRILLRLFERIGVFERSIGELEPIISEELDDLTRVLADVRLTPEEQELRARQIEVALAGKEHQIEVLRASEGSLTQLDKVLIDGFEKDNPGRGRFVGPPELAYVLGDLARRTGSSLDVRPDVDVVVLRGTPALASLLRDLARKDAIPYPGQLIHRAQEGDPTELALVPAEADKGMQLLTARHPLIRIAIQQLRVDGLALKRYGHVSLSDNPQSQYVALVCLFEGRGLESFIRLVPFAVGLDRQRAHGIEDCLFQAFAVGSVKPPLLPVAADLAELVECAQDLADSDRFEEERRMQVRDTSVVAARKASLTHSARVKIQATRNRLAFATEPRIRRMQEGRIRNLENHLKLQLQSLDATTSMVTSERVAVVVVDA